MHQHEPWIAIVDDDASVRTALARALRGGGFLVETFGSGEEFLRHTMGNAPGCMVLDINLAGHSGFELQDLLAARGTPVPIIFISAQDELAQRARARSPAGYLLKPFHMSALIALVQPHLRLATGG